MGIRPERGLLHAIEQLSKSGITGKTCAQCQRVYEQPDDIFSFRRVPSGYGCADNDIFLAGVTMQQGFERGHQSHEERDALFLAELFETLRELPRETNCMVRAAEGFESLLVRPRMIGGQFQNRRQRFELFFPIGELRFVHLAVKPLTLPVRVICVLDRQLGQRGRLAF